MVDKNDIEILLKAKRDRFTVRVLEILASLTLVLIIFIEVMGYSREYTILLATISFVLLATSAGVNRWVSVSKEQLIATLEKIVNNDPVALTILADSKG